MRMIHVILAGWMLITVSNTCLGKEWRGITPLKSSRADVERLFGRPMGPLPTYYLPDNTVTFWYSRCRCGDKCKDDDWNVPVDTVTSIRVGLKGINRLADLRLDLTKFKKGPGDYDVPGSFVYSNAEEGFAIEGGGDHVSALIYGPRAKDDYLRCRRDSRPLQMKGHEWRGIVPLKSNRADVERLLGPSTGDPPRYYLPENTVYFQYAKCRCGEKCKNDDWNVSPDTVISIMVGMKGVVTLADLKIDLTDFKKWPGDEDVPGSFIYKNDEDGFVIRGGGDYVSSLTYFPPAKDDHLRCPRAPTMSPHQ